MSQYADIIERLEKAAVPDRALDGLIKAAVEGDTPYVIGEEPGRFPRKAIMGTIQDVIDKMPTADGADYVGAERFTASLDAAISLVERMLPFGSIIKIANDLSEDEDRPWIATAGFMQSRPSATAAIALLIAMFRALEAQEVQS